ncbi:hypothetical protein [Facklamia hominis]|uniref:hypothetical protein n=1 Tax=Facklamia hominis TaxID=178214 RepID=UPI000353D030|nr:hypothetical protein [Facklamia hominis]EPH12565.1 hypothetical protein HMPREF9260_00680 [Facklamia hominis ACS-120-V-Sch10]
MITQILKDKELRDYLVAMVDDGCEVNLQVQCEVERFLKGNINHSEMMDHLEAEWQFQRRQRDVI